MQIPQTYINSEPIIDKYKSKIDQSFKKLPIQNISILGSFGTKSARKDSDMDIQIMLKSLEISLEEIVDISNIEIDIRKQISKCFELPNLTRHRASVFIKKERESYMQGFVTAFLYPRAFDEYEHGYGEINNGSYLLDKLGQNKIKADLAITLQHKNNLFLKTRHLKQILRNARDIYRYNFGERFHKDIDMYKIYKDVFNEDFNNIIKESNLIYQDIKGDIGGKLLHSKTVKDGILWTWEKTRWEMIESYNNNLYFQQWRKGNSKGFGFTIPQIIEFIRNHHQLGIESELGLELIKLLNIKEVNKNDRLNYLKNIFGELNKRFLFEFQNYE